MELGNTGGHSGSVWEGIQAVRLAVQLGHESDLPYKIFL